MFESKEALKAIHEKAMALVTSRNRGDVISMDELESVTGLTRYVGSWNYVIHRLKKRLLKEYGVAMWINDTGSYRLLTNEEQVKVCSEERMRRAYRQTNRAHREVSSVDSSVLGLHDAKRRALTLQHLTHVRKCARRSVKEFIGLKKTESLPIPAMSSP